MGGNSMNKKKFDEENNQKKQFWERIERAEKLLKKIEERLEKLEELHLE